jgi:hypothetical protein
MKSTACACVSDRHGEIMMSNFRFNAGMMSNGVLTTAVQAHGAGDRFPMSMSKPSAVATDREEFRGG